MNKTLSLTLASALLLLGAPLASADETHADCESGQDWISYNPNVDSTGAAVEDTVFVCEGEHWDGQDSIRSDDGSEDMPCADADAAPEHVSFCQDADPNVGGADPVAGKPLSFRVSQDGEAQYVAVHIGAVGQAVLYNDKSMTGVYLRDSTFQGVSDVNVLAIIVSSAGITKGWVSEEDCTHDHYQDAARLGIRDPEDPRSCGRDNTAVTVEHTPLP